MFFFTQMKPFNCLLDPDRACLLYWSKVSDLPSFFFTGKQWEVGRRVASNDKTNLHEISFIQTNKTLFG